MDAGDIYAQCRTRLLELAPSLTAGQIGSPLAATPPWTALDGYRHELLRIVFGRRSEHQTRAAGWTGASDLALGAIHLFDFPAADIFD